MQSIIIQRINPHCLFLFYWIILFNTARGQVVPLPNECKYKMGDHIEWAAQSFNDADWDRNQLGTGMKDTLIKVNIYVWYRIKVVIPSGMRTLAEKGDGIQLQLGRIDDADQTYFNGKLIGQSGSFPPDFKT